LIKFVPFWGLSLISTTVLFISPLIYKTNKEVIDHYVAQAAEIVNQQSKQVRELASQQAARATETTKQYVGDYSHKAQELIGNARGRSKSPNAVKSEPAIKQEVPSAFKSESAFKQVPSAFKDEDFPAAPREDFKAPPSVGESVNALKSDEPLIAA